MKSSRKRRNKKNFIQLLCCPIDWFDNFLKHKILATIMVSVYSILGVVFNANYPFPNFYLFVCLFFLIGFICLICLNYYTKQMPKIISTLAVQPGARNANGFYYAFFKKTPLYILIPIFITIIFGVGGCNMFGAISMNPTLFWILSLFAVVVYISIVGYLQYIFLFFYIIKLAHSKGHYINIQHNLEEYIPAELEWLQDLTKLCHIYKSAFFTLGSFYILAFGLFCFLPEMKTDTQNPFFLILWGIIFSAIVIVFPITTLIERFKIKTIVLKLKKTYVNDLSSEIKLKLKKETSLEVSQRRFFETMYTIQIMNSRDYPINSLWNTIYNVLLSLFNVATSIITIIQGITIFLVDSHHMF